MIAIAIAVGAEAAEVPAWKSQHKTGPTAARAGIEDCTVTTPAGVYEMVHLEFDAPVKWTYLGSCRDGKVRMDNLVGLREPGGWLTIQGNSLTGTFVHLRYPRGDDYYLDDGRHGPHNMVEEARKAGYAELPDFAKEKILQSADEVMVAMDARTGKTLWKAVIANRAENNQNHKDRGFDRTSAAGAGKVVGIGRHGTLFCFDAASGKPLWEAPAGVSHGTKLIIAEGIVVAPKDGCWAGFDLNTGELVWKHPEPGVTRTSRLPRSKERLLSPCFPGCEPLHACCDSR